MLNLLFLCFSAQSFDPPPGKEQTSLCVNTHTANVLLERRLLPSEITAMVDKWFHSPKYLVDSQVSFFLHFIYP